VLPEEEALETEEVSEEVAEEQTVVAAPGKAKAATAVASPKGVTKTKEAARVRQVVQPKEEVAEEEAEEEVVVAAPKGSAAARMAARRQAARKAQQRSPATLITAEHFAYVK
jgi:hypothetical protein